MCCGIKVHEKLSVRMQLFQHLLRLNDIKQKNKIHE